MTAAKQARVALTAERRFLRQVIDINPNFVFAKDRQGRFTLVNQAVADVYGASIEGLVGKADSDFNSNEAEVEFFRRVDRQVLESGRPVFIAEEPITRRVGSGALAPDGKMSDHRRQWSGRTGARRFHRYHRAQAHGGPATRGGRARARDAARDRRVGRRGVTRGGRPHCRVGGRDRRWRAVRHGRHHDRGSALVRDPGDDRRERSDDSPVARYSSNTAGLPYPDVVSTGEPIFITNRDDYLARFPALAETLAAHPAMSAFAVLPLTIEGRVDGKALSFDFQRAPWSSTTMIERC